MFVKMLKQSPTVSASSVRAARSSGQLQAAMSEIYLAEGGLPLGGAHTILVTLSNMHTSQVDIYTLSTS